MHNRWFESFMSTATLLAATCLMCKHQVRLVVCSILMRWEVCLCKMLPCHNLFPSLHCLQPLQMLLPSNKGWYVSHRCVLFRLTCPRIYKCNESTLWSTDYGSHVLPVQMLGDSLYPLVKQLEPVDTAKVTGMLLEMDQTEVLHLLESPDALRAKVAEAMEVLRSVAQQQQANAPAD